MDVSNKIKKGRQIRDIIVLKFLWKWKFQQEDCDRKHEMIEDSREERWGKREQRGCPPTQGSSQNLILLPQPKGSLLTEGKRGKIYKIPFQGLPWDEDWRWAASHPLDSFPNLLQMTNAHRDCCFKGYRHNYLPNRASFLLTIPPNASLPFFSLCTLLPN